MEGRKEGRTEVMDGRKVGWRRRMEVTSSGIRKDGILKGKERAKGKNKIKEGRMDGGERCSQFKWKKKGKKEGGREREGKVAEGRRGRK